MLIRYTEKELEYCFIHLCCTSDIENVQNPAQPPGI